MDPCCVMDYQALARRRLAPEVWDFIEGGGGAELTLAANREAFDRVRLRPRVLVDVSVVDTTTTLLGSTLAAPVGIAPMAYHQLVHPEAEVGTAMGAAKAGALYVVGMFASRTFEEIAATATSPLWLQLYWLRRRDVMADIVARAEACGYQALVLTVDAPVIGRRLRDLRHGFAVDPGVAAINIDRELMASTHQRRSGESAIATHARQSFDPSLSWTDLAWVREHTRLPLILKGILTGADAARAVEHGVDGVIVSNHGGRQLDGVPASLPALAEVVDAVAGRCPVLVDGGIRRGTDIFAALAVGADTVLIGRPVLWALAADGGTGVASVLALLREELAHTMTLAGTPTLSDVDRRAIALSSVL